VAADENPKNPVKSSRRHASQLRWIGFIVLVTGVTASGLVYWLGTRSPDLSANLSMQGFNRAEQRQMARLYGKSGLLIDEWSDALARPGTQAILIAAFSALVFAGCFYFARLLDVDDPPPAETGGASDLAKDNLRRENI
jgi:hypothetical protein